MPCHHVHPHLHLERSTHLLPPIECLSCAGIGLPHNSIFEAIDCRGPVRCIGLCAQTPTCAGCQRPRSPQICERQSVRTTQAQILSHRRHLSRHRDKTKCAEAEEVTTETLIPGFITQQPVHYILSPEGKWVKDDAFPTNDKFDEVPQLPLTPTATRTRAIHRHRSRHKKRK
eukprot:Blabericola_migrator_1__636@NODE_1159_length_5253_cov_60_233899_g789_i0_p4_GENE_NODE_1159_length_5253_cov_60_233899_g789_i0NODE_1159_length_5253_cov_60_233899_g789_i0_p4_ORF_typecomplete_len172_score10_96_NODE_1159_length_5253_cov_60_233899_g789_i018622377